MAWGQTVGAAVMDVVISVDRSGVVCAEEGDNNVLIAPLGRRPRGFTGDYMQDQAVGLGAPQTIIRCVCVCVCVCVSLWSL